MLLKLQPRPLEASELKNQHWFRLGMGPLPEPVMTWDLWCQIGVYWQQWVNWLFLIDKCTTWVVYWLEQIYKIMIDISMTCEVYYDGSNILRLYILVVGYIENNVCTRVTNCFSAHSVYFLSCEATREINTKVTLEWAQKLFVPRVHTLFYFLHDITTIKNDDKNNNLHALTLCLTRWVYVLLMMSQSIVDDVTITRQLWRDHVNSDI